MDYESYCKGVLAEIAKSLSIPKSAINSTSPPKWSAAELCFREYLKDHHPQLDNRRGPYWEA